MEIELREPATPEEFSQYRDLRWRILRQPWTGEKHTAPDDERDAIHLAAWHGNKIVGTGRLHFLSTGEAQVKGMAVERGFGSMGIGSMILKGLEERAARAGAARIVLHARESALEFYRKNHYQTLDRSYTLFHSIVHWRMRKDL